MRFLILLFLAILAAGILYFGPEMLYLHQGARMTPNAWTLQHAKVKMEIARKARAEERRRRGDSLPISTK
jgi:hypothetical protein